MTGKPLFSDDGVAAADQERGSAIAPLQGRAAVDRHRAAQRAAGRHDHGPCDHLGRAGPREGAGQRSRARVVELHEAVVDDSAGHRAGGAALAQLQRRADVDAGDAGVGVGPGEAQGPARQREGAGAGDDGSVDGARPGATVEDQVAVVGDRAGDHAEAGAVPQLQGCAGVDQRRAGVGVGAGEYLAARPDGQAAGPGDDAREEVCRVAERRRVEQPRITWPEPERLTTDVPPPLTPEMSNVPLTSGSPESAIEPAVDQIQRRAEVDGG